MKMCEFVEAQSGETVFVNPAMVVTVRPDGADQKTTIIEFDKDEVVVSGSPHEVAKALDKAFE